MALRILVILVFIHFVSSCDGQAFITRWKSDNPGTTSDTQIQIPGTGTNYNISWFEVGNPGNSGSQSGTGTTIVNFPVAGTYEVSIIPSAGTFSGIGFNTTGDEQKINSIEQWGSIPWLGFSFQNCSNLTYNAVDNPDLTLCTSLSNVFRGCSNVNGDLSGWNTSTITNIARAFDGASSFNGDISTWDVSKCTDFLYLFYNASSFNQNISSWNVSAVTRFNACFSGASSFDQPIGVWNTSSATLMITMFENATSFNQDLTGWDVSNVTGMSWMFFNASSFNGNISNWDVSSCEYIDGMFYDAISFNQDIGGWNTSSVLSLAGTFNDAESFNQDIGGWNTTSVTNMTNCFNQASAFNQDIGNWNTNAVTNMSYMFSSATAFDQNLNNWDVSSVQNMSQMFTAATNFNGNINDWNTSSVTNMSFMFMDAVNFNQDIGNWNTTSCTQFWVMFTRATSFNRDISGWDVSNAQAGFFGMRAMFSDASSFNQDLSSWDITSVTDLGQLFNNSGMDITNYDKTLIGWEAQAVQNNVSLGATGLSYCNSETERGRLGTDHSWNITGDSKDCLLSHFVTTWKTDNAGTSTNTQITIPTTGGGYSYDVDWDNDGAFDQFGITGNVTHDFGVAGTYTIRIRGSFPTIRFANGADKLKILSVDQWGSVSWSSLDDAFYGCNNLDVSATDIPDLSGVTNLSDCFHACNVTGDLSDWNTSTITTFRNLFALNPSFNSDVSGWDVSQGTNFYGMFEGAQSFNVDLSPWNVSTAVSMQRMFKDADIFNQDISNWNVSNVSHMGSMFSGAHLFNQPIGNWTTNNLNNISFMFANANVFDQDLSNWNTSLITTLRETFTNADAFNGDITNWNTESVVSFLRTFSGADVFNQNISGWNTSAANTMQSMFQNCTVFNQDLGGWDVTGITNMSNMLMLSGLDITNYDNTLIGWESQAVQSGVSLGATGLEYCNSEVERGRLGTDHSWTITGDSKDCELTKFIAIWKTDNPGTTNDNQIKIPCPPSANYTIEWEEVGNPGNNGSTAASSNYTLTLPSSGTYEIKISGNFVRIQFGGFNDPLKLLSIEQWGSQVWVGMNGAFNGCANMRINAVDKPNLQSVTDMGLTFANCTALNDDIGDWDVSNVSNFNATFNNATSFNQDLGDWDVSSGFSFALMFDGAASFNQDIGSWDVSNGWIMNSMFADATDFNQDISSWEMGTNAFFSGMFSGATAFNQDLSNWDVTGGSDFTSMFSNATSFNQDISTWDMSGATQFAFMFRNASAFDQSLGAWDISGVTGMFSMLDNCGMSMTNYDITLMGWGETASAKNDTGGGSVMAVQPNLSVGVAGLNYCNGESARAALITNEGWTFFGDSKDCFLLPIELSEFTAYRTSNHVDILWSTSSEINNDFFEIQRSVDNESWESIQVVAGAGNSNYLIDYIAIDENPLAGLSYYRIKQVDFDGRMSYTQSVSVNFKMQNEDKLIIYPNPSSDIVQFNSTSNQNQIDVFSQLGQKIDIEIQKQGSVIRVDVSSLPNGVYFISNNSSIGSFVKN